MTHRVLHDVSAVAAEITPKVLYERVRDLTAGGHQTDEELAVATGIPVRTLKRWKKQVNPGADFSRVIQMLRLGGFLAAEPDDARADLEMARLVAQRLADDVEQLADLLAPENGLESSQGH